VVAARRGPDAVITGRRRFGRQMGLCSVPTGFRAGSRDDPGGGFAVACRPCTGDFVDNVVFLAAKDSVNKFLQRFGKRHVGKSVSDELCEWSKGEEPAHYILSRERFVSHLCVSTFCRGSLRSLEDSRRSYFLENRKRETKGFGDLRSWSI
jgi:hypothetical protein